MIAALQIEGSDTPEDVLAAREAAQKDPRTKEEWYTLLFDLFDADESGTMEFEEFMPLMKGNPTRILPFLAMLTLRLAWACQLSMKPSLRSTSSGASMLLLVESSMPKP